MRKRSSSAPDALTFERHPRREGRDNRPDHNPEEKEHNMFPNTWKVVTAGAALTGLSLLGAGVANATADRNGFFTEGRVMAMDDSPWDDTSWD